ncbi:MAG: hypothetical protein K2I43_04970 [Alistipes sp.]|nr:hypothetical protein [Alistipes sp.]
MSNNQTKRLDVMHTASLLQRLSKPVVNNGKTFTFIYYNIVLKNDDLMPITITRFYRYMRIDTSCYQKLRSEFIATQLEKMKKECRHRNKTRRVSKRKALFVQSAHDASGHAAAAAKESPSAETAVRVHELAEQL